MGSQRVGHDLVTTPLSQHHDISYSSSLTRHLAQVHADNFNVSCSFQCKFETVFALRTRDHAKDSISFLFNTMLTCMFDK